MKIPFTLKIAKNKSINVKQAEVRHYRNDTDKGGITFLSYYINNENDNHGRIYMGESFCSISDNFGRKYGRKLAELRLVNNYRIRNGMNLIPENELINIVDYELKIKSNKSQLKKLVETKFNKNKFEKLNYEIEASEEIIESIWNN